MLKNDTTADAQAAGRARAAEDLNLDAWWAERNATAADIDARRAALDADASKWDRYVADVRFPAGTRVFTGDDADILGTVISGGGGNVGIRWDHAPWARPYYGGQHVHAAADQSPASAGQLLSNARAYLADAVGRGQLQSVEIAAYGVAIAQALHAAELVEVEVTTTTTHTMARATAQEALSDHGAGIRGAGPLGELLGAHAAQVARGSAQLSLAFDFGGDL